MNDAWIAERMKHIDASGIRKAFDMAKAMKDPINLSIGLPDFDVPDPVKAAATAAIEGGHNAYTVTQGIPELRTKLQHAVDAQFGHADRQVLVTAGTSGGLLLAMCCAVNPGDEVIVFDPYFVMYRHLATLAGGVSVLVDTYPDFRVDAKKVAGAPHRADQVCRGQLAGESDRHRRHRRGDACPGRTLPRAGHPPDQRRGLPVVLLRSSVRLAGDLERGRAGRRRIQQGLRDDRLAAGLSPTARPG